MMNINITNVIEVPAMDLAFWVSTNLLNVRIPKIDANTTLNIAVDILPELSDIAQKQVVATELYIVVTSAVPSQTSIKSSENMGGVKEVAYELGKKKDILYRTIQTLESARETVSRIMTGMSAPRS